MKYIALLLSGCVVLNSYSATTWRYSLSIDPSQVYTNFIEFLSLAVVMHGVSWLVGDKLLSRVVSFPESNTINATIAVAGLSVAEKIRRRTSNIKQTTSLELKIAAAYSLTTISYAAAASIPMKNNVIKRYNKYNFLTLVAGYGFTRIVAAFK